MNNTVKHNEDADAKNEELFKIFVFQRKEMVVYFANGVYVSE